MYFEKLPIGLSWILPLDNSGKVSCKDSVDTRFWHVSRKSVAKEKRFCVVRSVDLGRWSCTTVKILLTKEGEIDQIFWLRFGKSYLILKLVLFHRIKSCFAMIGYYCVSVGYKYEPPGYCKDWYTSNKHNFTIWNLLSRRLLRHPFFVFCKFFQVDQGRLTFERLGLLVSVRFTE